jgi:sulfur-oxidizing protein SoxY
MGSKLSTISDSISRRKFITATTALAVFGIPSTEVRADQSLVDQAIAMLIKEDKPATGDMIHLELPQIAENGNTVPIKVLVDSPMTADDYVKAVHIFAEKNPSAEVISFHFTPASGKASASTRMRLAKTQNVVALVQMSNGSAYTAKKQVKVTIGGCGG